MKTLSGWLIVNGTLAGVPKFAEHIDRFLTAFEKVGIRLTARHNDDIIYTVTGTHKPSMPSAKIGLHENRLLKLAIEDKYNSIRLDTHTLTGENDLPDFVLFWDKDIRLAYNLMQDFPVFNSPECIEICDDKSLTHHSLATAGVRSPATIFAPKYFKSDDLPPETYIDRVIDCLGLPLVLKQCFGSFGEGVRLAQSKDEVYRIIDSFKGSPYLFQEFIASSHGRDIRAYVADGVIVGAAVRENTTGDFRAGTNVGGVMTEVSLSPIEKRVALDAANAVGATFCGVDMLIGGDGLPLVCEVNSNAHFINFYRATGIDFASAIAKTIKKVLNN